MKGEQTNLNKVKLNKLFKKNNCLSCLLNHFNWNIQIVPLRNTEQKIVIITLNYFV